MVNTFLATTHLCIATYMIAIARRNRRETPRLRCLADFLVAGPETEWCRRSSAGRGTDGGRVALGERLSRRTAPIGDPLTCAHLLISRQRLSGVDNDCRLTRMMVVLCN